ncbi:TspO and MBR related proteins [Bryocella elongata]|uniref:TspO and MBR related proteins n=1 Tax=Bryocella elongata TaxID=863522 RepID=A0A1H5WKG5_9BACT|nr:tryptophan-rich sensory protein [Bryocella elongata]SEF99798.1 TspO and MBR related proteins [Bryocella elongata]
MNTTMPTTANTSRKSLALTLAIYLLSPLLLNGIIFALHWDTPHPANPMLPPGAIVGSIWMLLFLAMGLARWLAAQRNAAIARWPDALALACMLYPLYTAGLRSLTIGFWGTVATLILAAAVLLRVRPIRTSAAALIVPVIVWLAYAGTALGSELFR